MKGCYVIVNYNGYKFLSKFIYEVIDFAKINNLDLIVADDNSKDNSLSFLDTLGINYIVNRGPNRGYAANANSALYFLKQSDKSYEFFIIANNDIRLSKGFVENFSGIFLTYNILINRFSDIGIIGFREILYSDFSLQNFTALEQNINWEIATNVPGFFYILNSAVLDKVGFFDEEYFMYGEEIDLFYRIKNKGFQILNCGLSLLHISEGSGEVKGNNSWLAYRNAILFAFKNLSCWGVIKTILSLLNQIYNPFLRRKHDPSYIRIVRSGFIRNNFLLLKSIYWNIKNKYNEC